MVCPMILTIIKKDNNLEPVYQSATNPSGAYKQVLVNTISYFTTVGANQFRLITARLFRQADFLRARNPPE